MLRLAIDTHLVTSHHLLPLLINEPGGLLVEVTDGTQGHELAAHEATAIAVTPGWLRSEMMLDNFGVSEHNWREALDPDGVEGHPTTPGSERRGMASRAGQPPR